jgi:thiamine-phosphate pyrophosphorylase
LAAIQLCLITDRKALGTGTAAIDALVELARDASAAGIDWIQLREKDLPARSLHALAVRLVDAVAKGAARIVVNDRFDVALAAGAAGVHLTTQSLAADVVRAATGARLVIGASTHSEAEARAAAGSGADYVVCGPVFATPSKSGFGLPLGAAEVARIAGVISTPLLALGGIDAASASEAMRSPVAGLAAIRLFQEAWLAGGRDGMERVVERLRSGC